LDELCAGTDTSLTPELSSAALAFDETCGLRAETADFEATAIKFNYEFSYQPSTRQLLD
jgi:hypothetical protein